MAVNPFSISGILIIVLFLLLPVGLCFAEYFLAKHGHEAGMFILPIVSLSTAFFIPWYGIVLALIVLSVGLLTKHLKKMKQNELDRMTLEDLGGDNHKK